VFVSLFQILKNCSSVISATFSSDSLHIQGMDKSHICLFDAKINSQWFNGYEIGNELIIINGLFTFIGLLVIKSKENNSVNEI
jgi:hypothetical protein